MLRLTFSQEDIKELDYQRYHHPHPCVQRKMEALLLKAKGLPHHQIAPAWSQRKHVRVGT